jgi:hypothetical protein
MKDGTRDAIWVNQETGVIIVMRLMDTTMKKWNYWTDLDYLYREVKAFNWQWDFVSYL